MAKNLLTAKRLNFLSLVDRPANQHSVMTIAKRASVGENLRAKFGTTFKALLDSLTTLGTGGTSPEQLATLTENFTKDAQSFLQVSATDRLWTIGSSLQSSVASILSDGDKTPEQKQALVDASLSQFRDAVLALNVDDAAFDALEDSTQNATKGVCAECGAALGDGKTTAKKAMHVASCSKYMKDDDDEGDGGGDDSGDVVKDLNDPQPPAAAPNAGVSGDSQPGEGNTMKIAKQHTDLAAANLDIGVLTTEVNTLATEVASLKSAAEAAADPLAAITKGLPPAAAEFVRKQNEEVANMRKREAARSRDERVTKMAGADAQLTADERAAMCTIVKALDGETVTADELKAAETFMGTFFKQYNAMADELEGMDLGIVSGAEPSGDAEVDAVVATKVLEIRKRAGHENLSETAARAIVWKENPDLYDAHTSSEANAS